MSTIGVVGAVVLIGGGVQADRYARIGAGYKAKVACSEIYLAGRDADDVIATEFEGIDPLMAQIALSNNGNNKTVSAAGPLGFGRAKAIYREGYGCTLANGGRLSPLPAPSPALASDPWPVATATSSEKLDQVDYAALDAALDTAFENNEANHRTVLVTVDG